MTQDLHPLRKGARFALLAALGAILLPFASGCRDQPVSRGSDPPDCETVLSRELCAEIGQMLIVGFGGTRRATNRAASWDDPDGAVFHEGSQIAVSIREQHVGGVILFLEPARRNADGRATPRNVQSPEQLRALSAALETFSKRTRREQGLPDLPLLVAIDQEGGSVDRLPTSLGFLQKTVSAATLGSRQDEALHASGDDRAALDASRVYAARLANELSATGINLNLAPCVDVAVDPRGAIGKWGRSFSADPEVVVDQAQTFVEAFHARGVLATLKHFPGLGSATADGHREFVDVTQSYLREIELEPYRRLIEAGYRDVVLVGHAVNGQLDRTQCRAGELSDPRTWCPATMSRATLTLLRQELAFEGVIVSDDMMMAAIRDRFGLREALEAAINAGVEAFVVGNHTSDRTKRFVDTIASLVHQKRVPEVRIHEASRRIAALKKRLGEIPRSDDAALASKPATGGG